MKEGNTTISANNLVDDSNSFNECNSTPFSLQSSKNILNIDSDTISLSGNQQNNVSSVINLYYDMMQTMIKDVNTMKRIIPINFQLGVIDLVKTPDQSPNIKLTGKIPNVQMSFLMPLPPPGPIGPKGENAPPVGDTGPTGPTGPTGENGYWGNIKNM